MNPSEMSDLLTIFSGAGGGIVAGGIAWLLFWKTNQRNEKIVDDRMNGLENAAKECEKDRKELHNQFHAFQNNLIAGQGEVMREVAAALKELTNRR
jgi:hypothetical protein